jgi:DNA-binding CsgD family transcriptional regulator
VFADLFAISLLAIYWISSVFLFQKNTFYAFFSIAYSLILVLAIDFFILPLLGLPNIGITTAFLKAASVFEMIILSYAVVYRMKILKQEHLSFQQSLFHYTTQIEKIELELSKLKSGEENRITAASLSAREVEILTMIANGTPTKEIADKLFISVNTVKYHIKKLYDKLEISTRQEAKIKAAHFQDIK